MTKFVEIVIGVQGDYNNANNDDYCQVIVANKIGKENHDTVGYMQAFHEEYTKINNNF